ncbi:MAG TPA: hypothetical protein VLL28_08895 [Hyphomicrobiaceae bacterium]|nr:hypothetical protein [Hyphomicrobiaceae bacterium]
MAKRYSPLTLVALVGAFALLGYMGARLSQKQALLTKAGAPPPTVRLADQEKAVAPSEHDGKMLVAGTPADTAESVTKSVTNPVAGPADTSARTRLAAAPPLPSNKSVGERTTHSAAAPKPLHPTPPAAPLNQASGARDSGQTGLEAEMPSNPAEATGSHERRSRFAERTAAARLPALGADDKPVERSRTKRMRAHQARHRDGLENSGFPGRSHNRRYAAGGDLPAPSAPGFRAFPFLPIFLPF